MSDDDASPQSSPAAGGGGGGVDGSSSMLSPQSSPLGSAFPSSSGTASSVAPAASASALDSHSDLVPEATRWDESLARPLQLALGEELLLPFVEEYAKLQQALLKSHESETRFVNKCKALSKQTRAHTHKLTALHAIHLQDAKRKQLLVADIDKHKLLLARLAEEMKEKKEGVRDLRQELQSLGAQLEESSQDFLRTQRSNVAKLELEVSKYSLIRDKDRTGLTKIRSKNIDAFRALQDLLAALSRSQQEFDGLEAKLLEARALSGKELRRKAELEKHMKEVQSRVAERQAQLATKKDLIAKAQRENQEVELQLSRSDKVVELHRNQYEELNEAARQANESLLDIQESNESLSQTLKRLVKEVDEDRAATKAARQASEAKLKALESMRERVRTLAEETRVEEDEKLSAQQNLKVLKEQIAALQFKLNANAKAMDTCVREREVLAQNHSSKVDAIKGKEAALKIKQSTLKNIRNEHQGYLISIRALTKILEDLKRDKAAHEVDLNRRMVQKARALEEVSQRELQITEYQSQIVINEGKLRQQQNLLEAVRSDRNAYRKTLIEQQTEMHEYKRKFHFLSTQVRQSKSEIEDKNQLIVFEHFNLQNVRDDIAALETQNGATHASLDKADALLRTQQAQIRKLSTIIADADEELRVQIKQYNSIVNEQRVLNAQLVKRNDELASLYEQLKLQNSILAKSAAHYKEKQLLLHEYEHEAELVTKTLNEVLADIGKFVELKDTISALESQLVAEQLKVKALSDELKKPINIHRWRRLMDTNTDTYGMIKKVRGLQADIIAKSAAVQTKDAAIAEKEKLYVELRRVLARQPGSEAAEQLRVYLEQLDEKRAKLKAMKSELKLYQTKVKEHQYDLQRLDGEMQLLKLAYFQRRKASQRKGGGNGGGDGKGTAWRGQSAGGIGGSNDLDDMPDILRPTEFPTFAPPPDLDFTRQQAQHAQQQPPRSADSQSHVVNPYLASAASANPFPSASSASASARAQVRGLDEDDEDDQGGGGGADSGADDDIDRDFRDDEREEAIRRLDEEKEHSAPLSQAPSSQQQSSQSLSRADGGSSSRASLRSASRQSVGRPESRSGVPSLAASAMASATASAGQLSQRSDSRNSARGGSQQPSQPHSQRGEAGFSRFPNIGTAQ